MKIIADKKPDVQEWDRLAAELGGGYFHGHAQVLYDGAVEDSEAVFLKAVDDSGQCIGVATGTIARSHRWPFSSYCNWAMLEALPATLDDSDDSQRSFMVALENYLREQGVFSVHVYSYDSLRSENVLSSLGYHLEKRNEFIVDLKPELDDIWSAFKGSRRTDIRKAEKSGMETRFENTAEAMELVFSFQSQSMERRGIEMNQAQQRIQNARQARLASGHINVLVSYHEKTPTNAAIFGIFNSQPYYLVSGSSDEGFKNCGPAQLIWTAIKAYKQQGAEQLNLGAVIGEQKGLHKFKRDFGSSEVSMPVGKKRISRIGSGLHRED